MAKIVLPFLVGITTIDSVHKLKQLAWVILLSQGFVAYELNLTYFAGYNRLWEEGFGGMDNNCNAIAFVTCVGLAFFLGLSTQAWWRKALALGAAILLVHAILFSFSRGGMLALVVTSAVMFILTPKRPKHYLILVLFVLVMFRLAGSEVSERFATSFADPEARDISAESRLQLWTVGWSSMLKNPMGIGPAQWADVAHEYGFNPGKLIHSLWFQIGVELGFPGLLAIALFYLLCIASLWPLTRPRSVVNDPWLRDAARMVVAALVGFIVAAQFVSLWGLELPYYVVLIGAGVLKVASLPVTSVTGNQESARAPFLVPGSRESSIPNHGSHGWHG